MDKSLIPAIVGFASAAIGLIAAIIGRKKEVVHRHEYGGEESKRSFTSIGRIGILIAVAGLTVGLAMLWLAKLARPSPFSISSAPFSISSAPKIPPEIRLKSLKQEIDKIDRDIEKNLARLARMEVDVNFFEDKLNAKRDRQAKLRADISDMLKSLDARTEVVLYRGEKVKPSRLTSQLDMAVVEYNGLEEQVKTQEQLLADKKRTLEAAHNRLTAMKNEKEKLSLVAAKLATHLELVEMKQNPNQDVAFDDSALSNCQQLAKEIEAELSKAEDRSKLLKQYGFHATERPLEPESKSREEVLKSAREALQKTKSSETAGSKVEK